MAENERLPWVPLGRPFWTVWTGQCVSTVGSTLAGIGIAIHVYTVTGSIVWLGALLAFSGIPVVLVTPMLGLVDRYDRRHVMIAADLFAAAGPALAFGLALAGRLEVWHLMTAAFVAGLGNALQFPAYQAAIPDLVAPEVLGRANGVVQLGPALGIVIGPAVASVLLVAGGVEAVLLADLVSCAVGVIATALVPFRSRHRPTTSSTAPSSGGVPMPASSAWRWLRTTGRPLLTLMMGIAVVNLMMALFNVAALALATDLGGPGRAGLAPAIGGIAMVVTALAMSRTGVPARRVRAAGVAIAVVGVGAGVIALRPVFALVVAGMAIAMAAVPVANASVATTFHEHVPAHLQGRVFGLRAAVGRGLDPLGAALAGVVVVHVAGPVVRAEGTVGVAVRSLVGVGPGRDTAVVALIVGAVLVVVARTIVRHPRLQVLDVEHDVADAQAALPAGATT